MSFLGTKDTDISQLCATSTKAREFEHLTRLVFSFVMDKDGSGPSNTGQRSSGKETERLNSPTQQPVASGSGLHNATTATVPATQLDQFLAQLLNSYPYPDAPFASGPYNNMFSSGTMGHPQLPPRSFLEFAWNQFLHQQGQPTTHPPSFPIHEVPTLLSGSDELNHSTAAQPPLEQSNLGVSLPSYFQLLEPLISSTNTPWPAASATPPEEADVDASDGERLTPAEEKRRRNTAASARFRIKKKQRTIGLERSVSDLTSRAEELEREVTDLRRENDWLKEIVMLKGSQFAASAGIRSQIALSQAGQAPGGIDSTDTDAGASSAKTSKTLTTVTEQGPEEISSEDKSDEEDSGAAGNRKGKGKKPVKGKRKGSQF